MFTRKYAEPCRIVTCLLPLNKWALLDPFYAILQNYTSKTRSEFNVAGQQALGLGVFWVVFPSLRLGPIPFCDAIPKPVIAFCKFSLAFEPVSMRIYLIDAESLR